MPEYLWTEHVLPQEWTDEWPFDEDETESAIDEQQLNFDRDTKLHTLGNLTLVTDSLNISMGNKSFSTKKKQLEKHSSLFLNRWFRDQERWTEVEIRERGNHLADMAVEIWPSL